MLSFRSLQSKKSKSSGFTLVEVMIVIVILISLTQVGNLRGIFQTNESSKLEEGAIKIISLIDAEKLGAILGKTEKGIIVRKRTVEISLKNEDNTVHISSKVNLATEAEDVYVPDAIIEKNISIHHLKAFFYQCDDGATRIEKNSLKIDFKNDDIVFRIPDETTSPNHIVILLTNLTHAHEIHIDRRTGLTFERRGKSLGTDGQPSLTC